MIWWIEATGVRHVGPSPGMLLGALLPPAALWRDFFVFRFQPLSHVGAGRCRPHPVCKHSSGCVHAQSFLRKSANQLAASDPVDTRRSRHTQSFRPPPVQIYPVVGAPGAAYILPSHRHSLGRTSPCSVITVTDTRSHVEAAQPRSDVSLHRLNQWPIFTAHR